MWTKAQMLFFGCSALLLLGCCGVDALHCYNCNSHIDSRCADNIPPDSLKKDCSEQVEGAKYTMCRKIKQVIEFKVNGLQPDTRIIRSCGWDESSYKGRCYQRGGFGGRQEVCSCTTDYCNAAMPGVLPVSHSLISMCLLSGLAFVFARF